MVNAFLIAAHGNVEQLRLLIARLVRNDSDDYAVLHFDRSSPDWRCVRNLASDFGDDKVVVIQRPARVRWGHWTLVDAQRLLLREACRRGFAVAHHISGADWPVFRRDELVASVMGNAEIPAYCLLLGSHQVKRMQNFWWPNPRPSQGGSSVGDLRLSRSLSMGHEWVNRLLKKAGIERSRSFSVEWQKGSSWWSLPFDIAEVVLTHLDQILASKRLRFTTCSDEHVVPTILSKYFSHRISDYRRYIRWEEGSWSPELLAVSDIDEIERSGAWFARKVDIRRTPDFLTRFG
jgi:hypothetical protein